MIPPNAPNPNPIELTRKNIVDYLNASDFFQALPVLHDERGDIDALVNNALAKLFLVCTMEIPSGKVKFPALGAWVADLPVVFTITERVILNRDQKRATYHGKIATDVLCELFAQLHPLKPGGSPVKLEGWELQSNTGGVIIYQVTGKVSAGWKEAT